MGFSIADMLSGDIVKRREPVQDNSSAALGQMLQFLMNSNKQPVAEAPKVDYPSLSELSTISAGRRKEKQHADAMQGMIELVGKPGIPANGIPAPMLGANYGTPGTNFLGGQMGTKEFATRMLSLDDPNLQQAGMKLFEATMPTAPKPGVGIIPPGSVHVKNPDTKTWYWKTLDNYLIRDTSGMTENQIALQDPDQVRAIAGSKIAPTIEEATFPGGNQQKMTAEELVSLREQGEKALADAKIQLANGSIDKSQYESIVQDINTWYPRGQTTYDLITDTSVAKSDADAKIAALDMPTLKNDIQNMRNEVTLAIEDLESGRGQKQFLPGINRWMDTNILPDKSANRAIRIQGSKVLEILKAMGGPDSNVDLVFSQVMSGLDPYYTDKKTLLKNYKTLLTVFDYKEKVLESKYGRFKLNVPNAPKEVRAGRTVDGVYYKDVDALNKARRIK